MKNADAPVKTSIEVVGEDCSAASIAACLSYWDRQLHSAISGLEAILKSICNRLQQICCARDREIAKSNM